MKRILCLDYNYYLVPDDINLNDLLRAVGNPISREHLSNGNRIIYRTRNGTTTTLELIDDADINPPIQPSISDI